MKAYRCCRRRQYCVEDEWEQSLARVLGQSYILLLPSKYSFSSRQLPILKASDKENTQQHLQFGLTFFEFIHCQWKPDSNLLIGPNCVQSSSPASFRSPPPKWQPLPDTKYWFAMTWKSVVPLLSGGKKLFSCNPASFSQQILLPQPQQTPRLRQYVLFNTVIPYRLRYLVFW